MSIGVLQGPDPWNLVDSTAVCNPIISAADVPGGRAAFVADPFGCQHNGKWFVFFEFLNTKSGKGEIAVSESADLRQWTCLGDALVEPFHLSYPAIYLIDGQHWMVPETWESNQVRLYRAVDFPTKWVLDRVLIDNIAGTDPTIFRDAAGKWRMLLCAAEDRHNETLLAFQADSFFGPWSVAPESPLVEGRPEQARPGGHCFTVDGTTYRLGQDSSTRYGEALRSYPLREPWSDAPRTVVAASGDGWRARGGHHADLHVVGDAMMAFADGEA